MFLLVMLVAFISAALLSGAIFHLAEPAIEQSAVEAANEYKEITVPDDARDYLSVSKEVVQFTESYSPLLGSKWREVRNNYATNSRNLRLAEAKYQALVEVSQKDKLENQLSEPLLYTHWKADIQKKNMKLEKVHNSIKKAMEEQYAASVVRGIDSDAELKAQVDHLLKAVDAL